VIENTRFDFDRPADVPTTPAPSADTLRMMRTVLGPMLVGVYPQFAKIVFGACIPAQTGGVRNQAWRLTAPALELFRLRGLS
jgi:glutaconate CoA-transferase subunit B